MHLSFVPNHFNALTRRICGLVQKARYRRRITELQIKSGQLEAPKSIDYICEGHENDPFVVSFYNQTEPPSAVITYNDKQEIALASTSGSGAKYTSSNVEY